MKLGGSPPLFTHLVADVTVPNRGPSLGFPNEVLARLNQGLRESVKKGKPRVGLQGILEAPVRFSETARMLQDWRP